jgi:hypothetical protein
MLRIGAFDFVYFAFFPIIIFFVSQLDDILGHQLLKI